jgi:hypothetical protein
MATSTSERIFNLDDWLTWLNEASMVMFGMSGDEFRSAYARGSLVNLGSAHNLASVLPLIDELKAARSSRVR